MKNKQSIDFEASIVELEQLVEKMERGEFTLEESLQQFERGIALARSCQQALREAEQKVHLLMRGEPESGALANFNPDEAD
ncbi:MAG: exodeoxyribonuclease VII small subunit [Gammaproteobacteria bacterium]|nr:exodeoxyribonuclease VII small subunit [Gammaproteobacteria bacterium]MBI5618112.1 exodeoxyribonuclease VII small subunit [Gammaproteobacteria bacterium]